MQTRVTFNLLFLSLLSITVACKKNTVVGSGLSVIGFSTVAAASGDTIKVFGEGFGSDVLALSLSINGSNADIVSVENLAILTVVPKGVSRGKVTVKLKGQQATSDDEFLITNLLKGVINEDVRLVNSQLYLIRGEVTIAAGSTLTIDPGTLIFGEHRTSARLTISAGATIVARGLADKPIVFASDQNPVLRRPGDWGGIVLATQPADNPENDVLSYIRVEFGGAQQAASQGSALRVNRGIAPGNLEYVQTSYSLGDGFHFGGASAVALKHLVAFGCSGNDFSFTENVTGVGQYLVSFKDPNYASRQGADGLLVQTEKGVAISNYTYMGYNSLARRIGPYPFIRKTAAGNPNIISLELVNQSPINVNAGRGVRTGGLDLETGLVKTGSLSLYNSVIAGYWLAGISYDGPSWNASTNDFAGNVVTRTTAVQGDGKNIVGTVVVGSKNIFPFRGGAFARETSYTYEGGGFVSTRGSTQSQVFASKNDTLSRLDLEPVPTANPPFDDLGLKQLADIRFLKTPSFLPQLGSKLLTGGDFSYPTLQNSFFVTDAGVGAFTTLDWTAGWFLADPASISYF